MNKERLLLKGLMLFTSALMIPACNKSPSNSTPTGDDTLEVQITSDKYLCDETVENQGAKAAYDICLKQAQDGNVHAKARLGMLFAQGSLGEENWEQAMIWLTQAANLNHPEAIYIVAQSYQLGRGVKKNSQDAFNWLKKAAELEYVPAQALIGVAYLNGQGVAKDLNQAKKWLTISSEKNNPTGQCFLAQLYIQEGNKDNFPLAHQLLKQAAESGDPLAMVKLGDFYRKGLQSRVDLAKAQFWYAQALEKKSPTAQYEIAQLILNHEWNAHYDPLFLLGLAADSGHSGAQLELARRYQQGLGVNASPVLALKWYQQAAVKHEPEALYQLGLGYVYGIFNQEKNVSKGTEYLKESASLGYYGAQYALACMYLEGHPVLASRQQAIEYLRHAAQSGSIDAQIKLAKVLIDFSLPQYDKVAFHWVTKAATSNNEEALYLLGDLYMNGIGVEVDHQKAFQVFNDLAQKQNNAKAALKVGQMYYYGQGVAQDLQAAKTFFLQAARGNIKDAQNWIAILFKDDLQEEDGSVEATEMIDYMANNGEAKGLYLKGVGLLYGKQQFQQNVGEGLETIEASANKQYVLAQRELGKIYEQGLFDLGDEAKAYQWYSQAAENDDDYSQYRLAHLFYMGQGTERNYIQSYAWAKLAAIKGHLEASRLKDELTELLNPTELSQAENLSKEYYLRIRDRKTQSISDARN